MCVCMYVCMYVYSHACMNACMHARMHACMYVSLYVCMHVFMYICIYVCMYRSIYRSTYMSSGKYLCTQYFKCEGTSAFNNTIKRGAPRLKRGSNKIHVREMRRTAMSARSHAVHRSPRPSIMYIQVLFPCRHFGMQNN